MAKRIGYQAAEDVAQEVWLKVYKGMALGSIVPKGNMGTYLYSCADRAAIDYFRKHNKKTILQEDNLFPELKVDEQAPLEVLLRDETAGTVRALVNVALRSLPGKYSRILTMRCEMDLSFDEIALREGLTNATARWRYHKAKLLLKEGVEAIKGGL